MKKDTQNKLWLGVFVMAGLVFLSVILYSLGDRRYFFDQTMRITTIFHDVNGLRPGNSVRLSGINIGTVEELAIVDDSLVRVVMRIEEDIRPHIKKNATATVGTDGLMGNRIILIHAGATENATALLPVEDGDTLVEKEEVVLEDMLAVLEQTNRDIATVAADLVSVLHKIDEGDGSLGRLLNEPDLVNGLEGAVAEIQRFSQKGNHLMSSLQASADQLREGAGPVGALLGDSSLTTNLTETLANLENASVALSQMGVELQSLMNQIQNGQGTAGALLTDPEMAQDIEVSLRNIREGSAQFNEVMEGLKHNILLRRYFRKKAAAEAEAKEMVVPR